MESTHWTNEKSNVLDTILHTDTQKIHQDWPDSWVSQQGGRPVCHLKFCREDEEKEMGGGREKRWDTMETVYKNWIYRMPLLLYFCVCLALDYIYFFTHNEDKPFNLELNYYFCLEKKKKRNKILYRFQSFLIFFFPKLVLSLFSSIVSFMSVLNQCT